MRDTRSTRRPRFRDAMRARLGGSGSGCESAGHVAQAEPPAYLETALRITAVAPVRDDVCCPAPAGSAAAERWPAVPPVFCRPARPGADPVPPSGWFRATPRSHRRRDPKPCRGLPEPSREIARLKACDARVAPASTVHLRSSQHGEIPWLPIPPLAAPGCGRPASWAKSAHAPPPPPGPSRAARSIRSPFKAETDP